MHIQVLYSVWYGVAVIFLDMARTGFWSIFSFMIITEVYSFKESVSLSWSLSRKSYSFFINRNVWCIPSWRAESAKYGRTYIHLVRCWMGYLALRPYSPLMGSYIFLARRFHDTRDYILRQWKLYFISQNTSKGTGGSTYLWLGMGSIQLMRIESTESNFYGSMCGDIIKHLQLISIL